MHILSPFLYIIYVKIITKFEQCPKSNIMITLRQYHNIFLSILSLLMFVGITIATFQENKFSSLNNLICKPYYNNWYAIISTKIFLYSKYLEWGDTLFLHLSNKPISMLQYTHHMTTAFLVYINLIDYISPFTGIFMSINCFIHIFMYWYFSFPKGFLRQFKKLITQSQVAQHIICLGTTLYTLCLENCEQNKYGNHCSLILYSMYLLYFTMFYVKSYM